MKRMIKLMTVGAVLVCASCSKSDSSSVGSGTGSAGWSRMYGSSVNDYVELSAGGMRYQGQSYSYRMSGGSISIYSGLALVASGSMSTGGSTSQLMITSSPSPFGSSVYSSR